MKLLNRILNDIKRGENIALYLTVPTAILVGILNLVGVLSPTLVAPLTLVILGLITITILGSRHRVEQLADKLTPSAESIFNEKSPPTLEQDIENAPDIWLIGVLGAKHARDFYSVIEQKLKKGHSIKILTVHPDPRVVEFEEMRVYGLANVKTTYSDIETGLRSFERWSLHRVEQTVAIAVEEWQSSPKIMTQTRVLDVQLLE